MKEQFAGKAVFVTGAGVGIGFGLCQAFAEAGAVVALNDVDADLAETAAAKINTAVAETRIFPYVFDVADVPAAQAAVFDFADRNGRLDIVIANAGVTQFGRFLDYKAEDFDLVTGVNLRGTFFTTQAAAKKMIELGTKDGRLLLTASVTGTRAFKSLGTYGMTKAGIMHLARTLAVELGEYGLTINAICPGAIVTERNLAYDPNYAQTWAEVTPDGRVGQVQDIVNTALFLTSVEAGHITGQTIVVDGGWNLSSPIPEAHPD